MLRQVLLKGAASGVLWTLIPLVVYAEHFRSFDRGWMLASGALVGVALALSLRATGIGSTRKSRWLCSLPVLLVAEASWAFLLTLFEVHEGSWPERWFELTLGIWWANVFGLVFPVLVPLTYWNIVWVMKPGRRRALGSAE